MFTLVLFVFFILLLDALVSAAEAAIYSVPMHRAKLLAEKGRLGKELLLLKESMEKPITTLIALSNLITIIGSVFAGLIVDNLFGNFGVAIFAALLTFLIMLLGDIAPKRLGERYVEPVALVAATPVRIISRVFT